MDKDMARILEESKLLIRNKYRFGELVIRHIESAVELKTDKQYLKEYLKSYIQ